MFDASKYGESYYLHVRGKYSSIFEDEEGITPEDLLNEKGRNIPSKIHKIFLDNSFDGYLCLWNYLYMRIDLNSFKDIKEDFLSIFKDEEKEFIQDVINTKRKNGRNYSLACNHSNINSDIVGKNITLKKVTIDDLKMYIKLCIREPYKYLSYLPLEGRHLKEGKFRFYDYWKVFDFLSNFVDMSNLTFSVYENSSSKLLSLVSIYPCMDFYDYCFLSDISCGQKYIDEIKTLLEGKIKKKELKYILPTSQCGIYREREYQTTKLEIANNAIQERLSKSAFMSTQIDRGTYEAFLGRNLNRDITGENILLKKLEWRDVSKVMEFYIDNPEECDGSDIYSSIKSNPYSFNILSCFLTDIAGLLYDVVPSFAIFDKSSKKMLGTIRMNNPYMGIFVFKEYRDSSLILEAISKFIQVIKTNGIKDKKGNIIHLSILEVRYTAKYIEDILSKLSFVKEEESKDPETIPDMWNKMVLKLM